VVLFFVLAVFLLALVAVLLAVLLVFLLLFFLPDAFAKCIFSVADALVCSEAWASGEKVSDVNSKAQSVMETLFIRATEHSPGSGRHEDMPAGDDNKKA